MVEKFYILGKLGDSDGFQVIDLESKTPAKGDDALFFDTFHKDGCKELFEIRRVKYKTYYTYIKNDLSSDRTGCMLGFSYVYENNGNVIRDFLGLRQKMKAALNHLLEENGEIKIASFNDKKVIESLNHIEKFTKEVNAEKLPLPSNQIQFPTQNPNDLTNEQIWEMLKKSNYVEISEEIPTKLQVKDEQIKDKDTEIKSLRVQIQTKQNFIDNQVKEIEKLKNQVQNLSSEIGELKTKSSNAINRDEEIKKLLKEIEKKLSSGTKNVKIDDDEIKPIPQKKIGLESLLIFVLVILLVVDIIIGIVGLSNNSKEDNSTEEATIEELEKSKDLEEKEFDVWPEDINQENNPSTEISTSTKQPSVQKNEPTKEDAPAKKDKEKYEEWIKDQSNREKFTEFLKKYAEKNNRKYEGVNEDKDSTYKEIKTDEKIDLWKKHFKR